MNVAFAAAIGALEAGCQGLAAAGNEDAQADKAAAEATLTLVKEADENVLGERRSRRC